MNELTLQPLGRAMKLREMWREKDSQPNQRQRMGLAIFRSLLPLFFFVLEGCDVMPVQYPSASTPYPVSGAQPPIQSVAQPEPQVTGAQRTQYMWDTAMQGLALGGSIGGIYGAGGGLIIGLITGFFTADAHYTQINNRVQSEQAKTDDIEAKIEQEMQRQRNLEAQLGNTAGKPAPQKQTEPPQSAQKPIQTIPTTVAKKEGPTALASLGKKESPSDSPRSPFKNVEVRDTNGDGIADLWIYYNPSKPGEIVREEEATHGDGRVDTWSYFNNGKLVRREVDTKGKGMADTVYYYENDKIAREDRDENSTGHVSFRALYQNGRLAKVEKDTSGGGKPDLWIYYDTTKDGEVVSKEERDLNGDGVVDLWSYYEDGRLVRRDLSAVGLELLSKQDQLPPSPADPKEASRPQLAKDHSGHI